MNAYYFDENAADDSWVAAAQRMGVDVLTPREAGMLGRSDPDQLTFAASVGRAIITHDISDYLTLHAQWLVDARPHAGIVLHAQDDRVGPGDFARRLVLLSNEPLADRILYLPRLAR